MEYKTQQPKFKPRLIIHGGAGNIRRDTYPPELYHAYREGLISIVTQTNAYMTTPLGEKSVSASRLPSALDVAVYAVRQLEDNPLFNSGHGAVFTRDGINELEASVMVSRGRKKRGVGVMGLRRVRNPILLAHAMLDHGEEDLTPPPAAAAVASLSSPGFNVPSGQGHSQLWGGTAEQLAEQYGMDLVDPGYFFTQRRWDEHVRALEREQRGLGAATWSADEYLPQGTCGAVALDEDGVICAATSTGGLTNKLTGRIGDTPTLGAGYWAEEWTEDGDPTRPADNNNNNNNNNNNGGGGSWQRLHDSIVKDGPSVLLSDAFKGALADCLPTPLLYTPVDGGPKLVTTRSVGGSGTGNGDSFLRVNALRTAVAMARWKPETGAQAVTHVAGPGGELEKSAGDRWRRTGEGEGGIIGIESAIVRDEAGNVVETRSDILMDFNCGGMFRAWIDNDEQPVMSIWTNGSADKL